MTNDTSASGRLPSAGGFGTLTGDRLMRKRAKTFLLLGVGAGGPRPAWVAVVRSGEREGCRQASDPACS